MEDQKIIQNPEQIQVLVHDNPSYHVDAKSALIQEENKDVESSQKFNDIYLKTFNEQKIQDDNVISQSQLEGGDGEENKFSELKRLINHVEWDQVVFDKEYNNRRATQMFGALFCDKVNKKDLYQRLALKITEGTDNLKKINLQSVPSFVSTTDAQTMDQVLVREDFQMDQFYAGLLSQDAGFGKGVCSRKFQYTVMLKEPVRSVRNVKFEYSQRAFVVSPQRVYLHSALKTVGIPYHDFWNVELFESFEEVVKTSKDDKKYFATKYTCKSKLNLLKPAPAIKSGLTKGYEKNMVAQLNTYQVPLIDEWLDEILGKVESMEEPVAVVEKKKEEVIVPKKPEELALLLIQQARHKLSQEGTKSSEEQDQLICKLLNDSFKSLLSNQQK